VNRRNFLKAMGFSTAAAALPLGTLGTLDAYKHFKAEHCYGEYLTITCETNGTMLKKIARLFSDQIRETIPREYRKNIIYKVIQPGDIGITHDPLGQIGYVSWKYIPMGRQKG